MISIAVDFNNMARGGLVKASILRASGPILEGETVRAEDPHEEDMAYEATVSSIEGRRVYLKVHWDVPLPKAAETFMQATWPTEPNPQMFFRSFGSEEARQSRFEAHELVLR